MEVARCCPSSPLEAGTAPPHRATLTAREGPYHSPNLIPPLSGSCGPPSPAAPLPLQPPSSLSHGPQEAGRVRHCRHCRCGCERLLRPAAPPGDSTHSLRKSKEITSFDNQHLLVNGPLRAVYNLNFLLKKKKKKLIHAPGSLRCEIINCMAFFPFKRD